MRILALSLALIMPSCLSSSDAVKEGQTVMVRAGHALEAVREAYVSVCGDPDSDAGPAPSESAACAKAKAAFNAAQSKYTAANDQL